MSESTVIFDPDVARSIRPLDELDRRMLTKLSLTGLLRIWLNLGIPLAKIPGEYWAQDVDEGRTVAVVSCPCGNQPCVPAGAAVLCRDEPEWESCARGYVFTGSTVLVANSPQRAQAA